MAKPMSVTIAWQSETHRTGSLNLWWTWAWCSEPHHNSASVVPLIRAGGRQGHMLSMEQANEMIGSGHLAADDLRDLSRYADDGAWAAGPLEVDVWLDKQPEWLR